MLYHQGRQVVRWKLCSPCPINGDCGVCVPLFFCCETLTLLWKIAICWGFAGVWTTASKKPVIYKIFKMYEVHIYFKQMELLTRTVAV